MILEYWIEHLIHLLFDNGFCELVCWQSARQTPWVAPNPAQTSARVAFRGPGIIWSRSGILAYGTIFNSSMELRTKDSEPSTQVIRRG